MLIRREQMLQLERRAIEDYKIRMRQYLTDRFPEQVDALGEQVLECLRASGSVAGALLRGEGIDKGRDLRVSRCAGPSQVVTKN